MRLPGFGAEAAVYRCSRSYVSLFGSSWNVHETASQVDFTGLVIPSACSSHCLDNPKTCTKDCWSTCGPPSSSPLCSPGHACCIGAGGTNECCPVGGTCVNGACACPSGLTDCAGTCVDLNSDPSNCGRCGVRCSSGACQNSQCVCSLPTPTNCNGTCTSLFNDPSNCGACGRVCPPWNFCDGGQCFAIS